MFHVNVCWNALLIFRAIFTSPIIYVSVREHCSPSTLQGAIILGVKWIQKSTLVEVAKVFDRYYQGTVHSNNWDR